MLFGAQLGVKSKGKEKFPLTPRGSTKACFSKELVQIYTPMKLKLGLALRAFAKIRDFQILKTGPIR